MKKYILFGLSLIISMTAFAGNNYAKYYQGLPKPMPEVAGDAACFVDPRDKESILKGLIKITSDHKYRFDLIEAGKSNAERFNINRIAHLYELVYMELSHNLN